MASIAAAVCVPAAGRLRPASVPGGRAAPRRLVRQAVADRGSGGAGLLERPGFGTLGGAGGPQTDSSGARLDGSGSSKLGGGNFRVLLIDSEKHTEERVVNGILAVVPGTDESHASNCFHTSRSIGMAIVTCAPKEHAEHYCQQLWQRGLRTNMEPDTTTI